MVFKMLFSLSRFPPKIYVYISILRHTFYMHYPVHYPSFGRFYILHSSVAYIKYNFIVLHPPHRPHLWRFVTHFDVQR